MLGKTFEHETTRKVTALFGTLFNDIHITSNKKLVHVPIAYGPAERYLRLLEEKEQNFKTQISLPRISFEFVTLEFDAARMTSPFPKIFGENPSGEPTRTTFNRIPVIASFNLYVMVGDIDDGLRIVEQILPFFHPSFHVAANDITDLGIHTDVAFTLNGTDQQDDWENDFLSTRTITWSLPFNAKYWLYGPILDGEESGGGLIKHIDVNFYTRLLDAISGTNPSETLNWDIMPDHIDSEDDPHEKICTIESNYTGLESLTVDDLVIDQDSLGNVGEATFLGSYTVEGVGDNASLYGSVETEGVVPVTGNHEWAYVIDEDSGNNSITIGVGNGLWDKTNFVGFDDNGLGLFPDGNWFKNNATVGTGPTYTTGDTITFRFEAGTNQLSVKVNDGTYEVAPTLPAGSLKIAVSVKSENDQVSLLYV